LIDKEIDQIYQMRGETVEHGGGWSSDAAGRLSFWISERAKLISFSDCAPYIGICGA